MNYGKLSIIMPVYNAEKYLEYCIKSILDQTYKNFELIIIDDGSTDDSLKICRKFQRSDKRIKIKTQENRGVSAARNLGLENASGKFIGFVDGDDIISCNMYENMIKAMIQENVDIVDSKVNIFYNAEVLKNFQKECNNHEYAVIDKSINNSKDMLIKFCDMNYYQWTCWSKVFRKEAIGNIRFNGYNAEDTKFILDLIVSNKSFLLLDNIYYHYRKNNPKSSTSKFTEKTLDIINFYGEFYKILEKQEEYYLADKWKSKQYILMLNYYSRLKFSNIELKKFYMEKYEKDIRREIKHILRTKHIPFFYKANFILFIGIPKIISTINYFIINLLDFKRFIKLKMQINNEKKIINREKLK